MMTSAASHHSRARWWWAITAMAALLGTSGLAVHPDATTAGAVEQRPGGPRLPPRDGPATIVTEVAGTAVIRGQVVTLDTGAPLRRAGVRLNGGTLGGSRMVQTDDQGRFEFRNLSAGRFTLSASRGGFVTVQYGQRRPGEAGTPIDVADGQVIDRLLIGLPRGSVITGRLTDEVGEPVVNVSVMAYRFTSAGGIRRLASVGVRDTTDDLGQYRLFGLPPGHYVVGASARLREPGERMGDDSGYAPTYFPGTTNASEAQQVVVAVGQEQSGISFGLLLTRLVRVAGQVIDSTGGAATAGLVTLTAADGLTPGPLAAGPVSADGSFRLSNVATGRYRLTVRAGVPDAAEFARMDISIGTDDVDGVTLVTAPAGRILGRVVTDTGEPLPAGRPLQVDALATDGGPGVGGGDRFARGRGRVGADGSFEVGGITDPRLLRVTAPSGWMLKAVMAGPDEVTDVPLDVPPGQVISGVRLILTQKVGTVTGTVYDARRQPVLDATIVLFPVDAAQRGLRSRFLHQARPNQSGVFTLTPLPHGDYYAVALQALADGQATDPDFLASMEDLATRVTIGEGRTQTISLQRR